MKSTTKKMLGLLLAGSALSVNAQQLAFPGAQGWGRFATGGRSGTVYHVTNLNDCGAGSLRDAVSRPNRIVVFDVAGVINLKSRLVFKNNLYVAGQTAPGEGVTVYGNGVSFSNADDIIVRHMRFRMGRKGDAGKDAAGVSTGKNMIFDHCSFSWGLDETFSISGGKRDVPPENITISNSVIGQGLLNHSAGGLIQSDHITLYRNLYCDNNTRNNKVKGKSQFVNNIVYNWRSGAYIMGGNSERKSYCNIEGNLFVYGPEKGCAVFTRGNGNFHFYAADNWQDDNRNGTLDPVQVTDYSESDRQEKPYDYPELSKTAGDKLVDELIPTVGASLPYRDYTDSYMVEEVLSFGKKGTLIGDEASLPYGTPDTWTVYAGTKRVDTDGDGMPDDWEKANGTDPSKDDAMVRAANGYANIENYINGITAADRDSFLRTPACVAVAVTKDKNLRVTWSDYTEGENGFVVEVGTDGRYTEAGRAKAGKTSYIAKNLKPGVEYSVRVCAVNASEASAYSPVIKVTIPGDI